VILDPHDVALCVAGQESAPPGGPAPMAPPIVQTSLFAFPTLEALAEGLAAEFRATTYTRGHNPTVAAVERTLATLERGASCCCFGSGMGAVSAVLVGLLQQGEHVLFVNQTYGPTLQLARQLKRFGVEHDHLLALEPEAVASALRPETRLVWMESPGTMLFRVLDVEAMVGVARERGVLTCLDNSWATPLLQKPLVKGVDLVVHSATKYLAGHSDVVAGVLVGSEELVEKIFYRAFLLNGAILHPFDAWLLLRGIRTLPARLEQHERNALAVARFLRDHPAVRAVHHPAFQDGALVGRQLSGFSGLFSFELARDDFTTVAAVVNGLKRFKIGVSWGGVESLVLSPARPKPSARMEALGIPPGLIRLSVGLEGAELLIEDLAAALEAAS